MIGQKISHYKITEKLGEGGMGVVYKAQDSKLDREVALKFLPSSLIAKESDKARFLQEAKAAAALNHPNITTIHSIEEVDDEMFIVMEYISGKHLKDYVNSKSLSVEKAISISIQIAGGLKAAHDKGIVHRDIKSTNIMSTEDEQVKIMDFGLAKVRGAAQLTQIGTTVGTAAYMSPEQARGEEIDQRADIWSFGIVLYEMLTGTLPFKGDYEQAVLYSIINEDPEAINNLNKEVPSELNDLVQKCLEKNKDKRYQTIKEFYDALIQVIKKYNYTIKMRSGEFQPAGLLDKNSKTSPTLYVTVALAVVSIIIALFIFMPESKYSSYEEAFFEKQFEESRDISKDERSLENVKAHHYYIQATALTNQDTIPGKVKREYQDLLAQNPTSPEAHYYLGLTYYLGAKKLSERDSVWILYNKAGNLGLNNIYLKLDEFIYYKRNGFTPQALETINILKEKYPENPDVMFEIASFSHNSDTSKAREYYEKTLKLYDNYMLAHLGLFQLALKKNNLNSAKIHLEKAAEIDTEDIKIVLGKTRLYEREGRFDKAEKHLKTIISSFGKNDVRFYISLARLYQKQDMFEQCDELIVMVSDKFPNKSYFSRLKNELKERKEWLQILEEHEKEKNMVQWSEDYEESLERAAREKKPVVLEFYTTRWDYGSKVLEEKSFPDQRVQELLKSYIPLRINAELNRDLANRYEVSFYPGLVISNENGEKLGAVRYYLEPEEPLELIKDLSEGLVMYKKYTEGASVKDQQITEVSNIKDAILLSKSKQMPVMAVVLSKESKLSNRLVNETFKHPMLQLELKKVILVKVDQAVNKSLIKKWDITYFPSILFLDDKGEILYQVQGYQSPHALADLITDISFAINHNIKIKDRIRWLYDYEETKSFALLQKKDIFVFFNADWCLHCQRTIDYIFTDPIFIKTINEKFVPVELNDDGARDKELVNSFGVRGFPTFLILDASQAEIMRLVGYQEPKEFITALDPEERKPILSILGPEKYQEFYNYENLSDKLYSKRFYQSAIQVMQKQIEIFPEYWESYTLIGNAYLRLKNPGETVMYFTKAIDKGADIDQYFADRMLDAYLQINDAQGFEKWFQNLIKSKIENSNEIAILYNVGSEFYEILKDRKSAISMAEKALKIKPDYAKGYIRLGRLYYLENRLDRAKFYLAKAIQIDRDDPRPRFYLGLIAYHEGDAKEKERLFDLARKKYGRSTSKVGWRIQYESRPGYFLYPGYLDLIEQGYRDKLQLDNNANTKNSLAYFLATENRNLNEAFLLVENVLTKDPDNLDALDTRAVILYQQGKYQSAHETVLQYEKRIIKDDLEKDPSYSYYLGKIKWAVGDTVSAKYYFKYALKQTEPNARGKRDQQELIKFMAENNL